MTITEKITAHSEDSWECLCGNIPEADGFWPCLADGAEVEPTLDGPWDEKLVVCNRCGRIMDQTTFTGLTWDKYALLGRRQSMSDPHPETVGTVTVVGQRTAAPMA